MELSLPEEIFLLAIHEDKGRVIASVRNNLGYGLSGAVLAELVFLGKLRVAESHRLELVDSASTGDEILDEVIEEFRSEDRLRKTTYWVQQIYNRTKKLQKRLAKRLVSKGIVVQDDDTRYLWVIPYDDSPEPFASAKFWIKRRQRTWVLTCGDPDLHDLALVSLVQGAGMLNIIFLRDELKLAKRRIYEVMIEKGFSNTTTHTIEEISLALEAFVSTD
ncbi:MAG: GPP34 family phosphoprotein [Chloroflexota bacterium]|nr:MAG: GPP34 family phosphoprotein [Chloroflexota bacterium]